MSAKLYTAAQIAAALGVTRQSVGESLRSSKATGTVMCRGNQASAWSIEALPDRVRSTLARIAQRKGHETVFTLLDAPPVRWMPAVPIHRIHPDAIAKATRLRDAVASCLQDYTAASGARAGDLIGHAAESFRRVMGFAVNARHIRRLLDRAAERDRGFGEWNRVEIYLDERPALKTEAVQIHGDGLPMLRDAIEGIVDPNQPTAAERELMWFYACEDVARLTDAGMPQGTAIRAAVGLLLQAPGLAGKSSSAIEKTLRRRLVRWQETGGDLAAVQDGRADNGYAGGRLVLSEADRNAILSAALTSSLAAAWSRLTAERRLGPELLARYNGRRHSKFYVPTAIRRELQPLLDALEPHHHGPRAAALAGAYINRDPAAIASMDWLQADDTTLPVYYWTADADGTIQLMRGQCLAMIDVRSLMVVGFVLISERNYSAFHIRRLITRVADEHGLPRKGFYFERGMWKNAKLLKGKAEERPWSETERGLMSLGLRFQHARWPRGKVIEGAIGIFQNMMEDAPGYCGRDERADGFERVKRAMHQVRVGKLDPREAFWSEVEWYEQLTRVFARYNETPQEGKYCAGLSPREAFERNYAAPVIRLTGSVRYMLAMHRMREMVTGNGIRIQFGNQVFRYKGGATGPFVGREVVCYFNPESPETLSFEAPGGTSIYTVEREIVVPAMDASPEVLGAALRQNDAHNQHARELYKAVRPKFSEEFSARRFRGTIADEISIMRGEAMAGHAEAIRQDRGQEDLTAAARTRAARGIGLTSASWSPRPARAQQQLEGMKELERLGVTVRQEKRT